MSGFVRAAIVGTGQLAPSAADEAGSPVDALVARLESTDRERAFLLRAGAHAVLRRAARVPTPAGPRAEPAAEESLPRASERVGAIFDGLLENGESALLVEALGLLTRAAQRLPEELLPAALAQTSAPVREALRPVLGRRGLWLARKRDEWGWALAASVSMALPVDLEARWQEATAAERRALLAIVRRVDAGLARKLVGEGWKDEKVEQRLAWLAVLAGDVTSADEELLTSMLSDRSAQLRVSAARLLWKLPEGALARSMRERAQGYLGCSKPSGGILGKLKNVLGAENVPSLDVTLPPETYDPAWERCGVSETPPQGTGRRQFWLLQTLAAVPPAHWVGQLGAAPVLLVKAAQQHEMSSVLIEAWTYAALHTEAPDWIAPLWDAWAAAPTLRPVLLTEQPLAALTRRLSASEQERRALDWLQSDQHLELLAELPRPWPPAVALRFMAGLDGLRPQRTHVLPVAAMALPASTLPHTSAPLEAPEDDYHARAYLRALENFHTVAALRRSLHQEIPT
jgi:hypothetical protein